MSLLMLAVVALFPVVLLALLLITSGLEGRVVGSSEQPGTRDSPAGVSAARPGGRALVSCQPASGRRARPTT